MIMMTKTCKGLTRPNGGLGLTMIFGWQIIQSTKNIL